MLNKIINRYGIWILIIVFFSIFASHSLLKHSSFNTWAWDLGIYDQQAWLYSRFQYPYNTVRGMFLLSDHFSLSFILLVPFYWIYSHAETLLIMQAMLVALSAFPLWIIAKHYSKSALFSYAITILYLSSVGIQSGIDFDFHLATIAVFFVSYFIYFFWKRQYIPCLIFGALACLTKEDMPFYVAFISIFLFLFMPLELKGKKIIKKILYIFPSGFKKERILAVVIFLFSILYAVVLLKLIMPNLPGQGRFDYFSFRSLGNNYTDLIKNIIIHPELVYQQFITNPTKIHTAYVYFKGFGFLPLLAPHVLLASAPFFMEKFVSDRSAQWYTGGQYGVIGMLELAFASVVVINYLKYLPSIVRQKIILVVSISLLIIGINNNTKTDVFRLKPVFKKQTWTEYKKYKNINRLITIVPNESSVASQNEIIPHLSNRKEAYLFLCEICSPPLRDPDYILLDERFGTTFTSPQDANINNNIKELIDNGAIPSKKYTNHYILIKRDQTAYLFKREIK